VTGTPFRRVPRDEWRRWATQPRLLGIALPFLVALVCSSIDLSILLLAWLPFLLGVASAAILRSGRALLEVPLALGIGALLSSVITDGLQPTDPGFIAGTALVVLLVLVPALIGAAIGVALGHELEQLAADRRLGPEQRPPRPG
jgi:hypothetical protein